jgi:glycine cleavage system H protein
MQHPVDLKYSRHHIWVRIEEGTACVGMTEDVQEEIQHFESVELPREGDELEIDSTCMSLHTKAHLVDVYAPLSGRIIEVNESLSANPDTIFISPYGNGWLFKMEFDEPEEVDILMSADDYTMLVVDKGVSGLLVS